MKMQNGSNSRHGFVDAKSLVHRHKSHFLTVIQQCKDVSCVKKGQGSGQVSLH